ncbi:MAG TPA: MFS transporter [Bryobacteraceae bacterium]|nr:MFS transporter [Bryobacteraceae bacterium]
MATPFSYLRPSCARHWVIVFAVTLSIITYIDRVCIAKTEGEIRAALGLTKTQMGLAFSAFAWGYALFEIPGGWLGDWLGPRRVLMRIVIWWSVFTAATGYAWSLMSLWVIRFLFGAGEAGCFPNLTKSFTTWLPQDERVRAQGIMWMSARFGGAFTPLLVYWVLQYMDWRHAFVLFGAVGVVWAIFFYWWYRDNPRDHKSVNAAELALLKGAEETASGHGNVPWGKVIRSRTVWGLWVQYFAVSYPWYFYITWILTYLGEYRGVTAGRAATYAVFPLLFGGIGCFLSGIITPRIARRMGDVARARRLVAMAGASGAAALMFAHTQIPDPLVGMLVMGLASFANDIIMPCSWGACMDVGGKYAGTLSGSMNMMGNLAGGLAPFVFGMVLDMARRPGVAPSFTDALPNFYIMAGIYVVAALSWLIIDPVTPLEEQVKS